MDETPKQEIFIIFPNSETELEFTKDSKGDTPYPDDERFNCWALVHYGTDADGNDIYSWNLILQFDNEEKLKFYEEMLTEKGFEVVMIA